MRSHLDSIDCKVEHIIECEGIPGASLAVIENGKMAWAKGYGVSDKSRGESVTKDTVFRACSLSKVVSAYGAIRTFAKEGLNLDTRLSDIVPHPTIEHTDANLITAQMVLSHSSGLSHTIRDPKLESTPGERFSYSSGGFAYLQVVIEHLRAKPFARYAREEILDPLGMTSSSFTGRDEWAHRIATSHDQNGTPLLDGKTSEEEATSSGSLLSTPGDMGRLLQAIVDDNKLCSTMIQRHVPVSDRVSWGIGCGVEHDSNVGDWGWQWGWSRTGFRHYMAVNPQTGSGIVVFTNGARGYKLWKDIAIATVGGSHAAIDWVLRDL